MFIPPSTWITCPDTYEDISEAKKVATSATWIREIEKPVAAEPQEASGQMPDSRDQMPDASGKMPDSEDSEGVQGKVIADFSEIEEQEI